MPSALRGVLTYVGHLFVAVIGTAIILTAVSPLLPRPFSRNEILLRDLVAGAAIALLLGIVAGIVQPSKTAYWIWVLPVFALVVRTILHSAAGSVLGQHPKTLTQAMGLDIERGNLREGFTNYALFVAPTARTLMYSLGAFAASQVRASHPSSPQEPVSEEP